MATPAGLEPATPRLEGKCAGQIHPMNSISYIRSRKFGRALATRCMHNFVTISSSYDISLIWIKLHSETTIVFHIAANARQ